MGKCKICEAEIEYCGDDSPMLKDDIWNQIVDFYGLKEYEKKAFELFMKAYNKWKRGTKFKNKDEYHLFICINCMEKALGRKLSKSDLIGKNIPFNKKFEEEYFNAPLVQMDRAFVS